jgi:hypothetical protein
MAVDTNTVRKLCLSLLNAAGYTNVSDASITGSTGNLTTVANAFASTDVGKAVYIQGAGTGGGVYSGVISGYTSATAVTVTPVAPTTAASVNASFGGDVDDDRRNLAEMDEAILSIDLDVCRAILDTPNHSRIGSFTSVTTTGVASGTILVGHVGTIRRIYRIRTDAVTTPASIVPFRTMAQWMRNAGSQFSTANVKENFVAIESGAIWFAGGGSVSYDSVALAKTTVCQAPDEYLPTIVRGVMAMLLPKEGDSPSAVYQQGYMSDLASIRQGNLSVPPIARQEARG